MDISRGNNQKTDLLSGVITFLVEIRIKPKRGLTVRMPLEIMFNKTGRNDAMEPQVHVFESEKTLLNKTFCAEKKTPSTVCRVW
jgi:hypothetical protein